MLLYINLLLYLLWVYKASECTDGTKDVPIVILILVTGPATIPICRGIKAWNKVCTREIMFLFLTKEW